ncbi:MAG: hypothetical protein PUP91_11310 [Rhizonema sp. PD37]|nr:hypothetical protein [Rhizonema sp. PD37]
MTLVARMTAFPTEATGFHTLPRQSPQRESVRLYGSQCISILRWGTPARRWLDSHASARAKNAKFEVKKIGNLTLLLGVILSMLNS